MNLETLSTNEIITKFGENAKDTGNVKVQVALLTKNINHLSKHLKVHKKDKANIRPLLTMVGKRRKLLRYMQDTNLEGYRALIKTLALRH